MKSTPRKWKWLIAVAVVLIVIVGGMLATIAYIRSESGSKRILAFAQDYLAKNQATKLEFTEGRLDPFKGLHFRNLKIVREQPPIKATIEIPSLDVDYEIAFLAKRIDIARIDIQKPKIRVEMSSQEPAKPTPTPQPSQTKLDDLIQNPPVEIIVRDFKIEDLDLDAKHPQLEAKVVGLDLHARFEMVKDRLQLAGDMNTGSGLKLIGGGAAMTAKADGKWEIDIRRDRAWLYEIKPSDWKVEVSDLKVAEQKISLESLRLQANAQLKAQSREIFKLDADSVELIDIKGDAKLGKFAGPNNLTIGSQTAKFTAKLANSRIDLAKNYVAQQIAMPGTFTRPVALAVEMKAQLPRDLSTLDLELGTRLENQEIFRLKASSKNDLKAGAIQLTGQLSAEATPKLADFIKPAAALRKTGALQITSEFNVDRQSSGALDAKLKAATPKIVLPSLKTPTAISLGAALKIDEKFANTNVEADIGLTNDQLGKWSVVSKLSSTLPPADAKPSKLPPVSGQGRTEIAQLEAPKQDALVPAKFPKPIVIDHRYDFAAKPGSVKINGEIPAIEVTDVAKLNDTKFSFEARSADLAAARDVDVQASLTQGPIQLAKAYAEKAVSELSGATMEMRATLRGGEDVNLDVFRANIDGATFKVDTQATANIRTKNLQANSKVTMRVPTSFPPVAGTVIRGGIEIPLTMTVLQGREASLDGHFVAQDLAFRKGAIGASGIVGRVPFSEKLIWDGKALKFASLITQNPFERVDFERVRPLLQSTEQFRVERIQWEEKTYGPFIGFFSMKQNLIFAHQFDMDIGTGRLSGELFLDAYPKNLQVGSLARITNVNLGEVLPKKFLARAPGGDKNVSGRSGFVVNLNRGTMDGRVDVTEIGGPQLIALANILDPAYEDEKLNTVRSLLQVGYPTQVALEFADGYLNMDIGLSVLGVRKDQTVRGIPISNLLTGATADLLKETQKYESEGPLQ